AFFLKRPNSNGHSGGTDDLHHGLFPDACTYSSGRTIEIARGYYDVLAQTQASRPFLSQVANGLTAPICLRIEGVYYACQCRVQFFKKVIGRVCPPGPVPQSPRGGNAHTSF